MTRTAFVVALLLVGISCRRVPATADLVIQDVSVIDPRDGTVQDARTLFVEDGRITANLASPATVPEGSLVVNGQNRFVVPGLWDAHVHSAASTSWHFPLMIAHGITAVRNMHTTVDDALALTNAIKDSLARGALVGPRFIANGAIVDGEPPVWPGTVIVTTGAQARAAVDSLARGGADFIKIYDSLDEDVYLALMEQARIRGIAVDGHMPFAVPPDQAARAGQRTVEHLSGMNLGCSAAADDVRKAYAASRATPLPFPEGEQRYLGLLRQASDARDTLLCARTIAAYRAAGVTVVPTLVNGWVQGNASQVVADSQAMRLLPEPVRRQWTFMAGPGPGQALAGIMAGVLSPSRQNVRALADSGVTILAGTDIGNPFLVPGRSLHDELGLLVAAGLTPLQALRAATWDPAVTFAMSDSLGIVTDGYLADLVILTGNPLEDIDNVRRTDGVVLRGQYFDRDALDSLMSAATRGDSSGAGPGPGPSGTL